MGIITDLFEKRALTEKKWLLNWLGGQESATGIRINEENAIKYSAVFGCVRIISETIASLPWFVYKRLERGKEKAFEHSLYDVLHLQPNSETTSFIFREVMIVHLLLRGNSYSEIVYDGAGRIKELWPLLPWKMKVERDEATRRLIYKYTLPNGAETIIPNEYVLHIPGFSFDGLVGKSPIAIAREAIGLGLAMEEFGARFFGNGTQFGGFLEHPRTLSNTALKNLKDSLREKYEGLSNAHRLFILEEGMKYTPAVIPPEDAQFLEGRKFQLEEIARIYRVPLHLLQNLDRATFNNIEELGISFVIHTIRPWLVRIEQAVNTKLFTQQERKKYFCEFLVDGLLRGSIKSRYEAYSQARQNGWMSANDIRELENMNPIDGGDIYLVPLNMIDASTFSQDEKSGKSEVRANVTSLKSRVAESYRHLFEDAVIRIIKFEKKDILKAASSIFKKRDAFLIAFSDFLENYYSKKAEDIIKRIKPVFITYAGIIFEHAIEESNSIIDDVKKSNLEKFTDDYATTFNLRYTGSSKGQLREVSEKAIQNGDDPIEKLEERFSEWEEKRPAKVSLNETIKMAGAVSLLAYSLSGIRKYVWVSQGSKSCPYCQSLSGKVIRIGESVFTAGENFKPEEAETPLNITQDIKHPPLHAGCVCMIMPA